MACIVPGCHNQAENNLGVRLRRANTSAIWSPNTAAYICDEHAAQGWRITVIMEPNTTGEIETRVFSPGQVFERTTPIVNEP
jgi:hypothetical protein